MRIAYMAWGIAALPLMLVMIVSHCLALALGGLADAIVIVTEAGDDWLSRRCR